MIPRQREETTLQEGETSPFSVYAVCLSKKHTCNFTLQAGGLLPHISDKCYAIMRLAGNVSALTRFDLSSDE